MVYAAQADGISSNLISVTVQTIVNKANSSNVISANWKGDFDEPAR